MTTISFKSVEQFDYISLLTILQNWDHIEVRDNGKDTWEVNNKVYVPKTIITNYLKRATLLPNSRLGEIPVTYKYSQIRKKQGRQFVVNGLGLQSFNKWFRHTICHDLYVDVDIVNAQPSMLVQYCQKNSIACPELLKYIQNRTQYLTDLIHAHNFSKQEAKQCLLAVINGGKRYSLVPWFEPFKRELTDIHQQIIKQPQNQDIIELVKKSRTKVDGHNLEGRVTNHILCQLENEILMTCLSYLRDHNYSLKNVVLCFDGFMLPKDILTPDSDFFSQLNTYVFQKTGYDLTFVQKPIDLVLNLGSFQCNLDDFQEGNVDHGSIVEDDADGAEILLQHLTGHIYRCQNQLYIRTEHYHTWTCEPTQVTNELLLQCTNLDIRKTNKDGKIVSYSRNSYACSQIIKKAEIMAPIDDTFSDRLFHQSINQ